MKIIHKIERFKILLIKMLSSIAPLGQAKIRPFVMIVLLLASFMPAQGHEFWIETEDWQIAPQEDMRFSLRIGSDFSGFQHVYIPHKFTRFEMMTPQSVQAVDGRIGDRPAGQIPARQIKAGGEGLYLIRHETTVETVSYPDVEKFAAFAQEKGLSDAVRAHNARGLPRHDFTEIYYRYAKGLIAVGDGIGEDQKLGMDVEITALQNPYHLKGDVLPLQLSRNGKVWPHVKVTVFARPLEEEREEAVQKETYTADAKGLVSITTRRGYAYLVDAVALEPVQPDDNNKGAVWLTRWASLTFARPQ